MRKRSEAASRRTSLRRSRRSSAVILLNGELRSAAALKRLARSGVPLLCADGGARHAAALGLEPRLVLGDMDSLPKRLPRWKKTMFLCDFDPNGSDFEKTLRFCVRRGIRKVWVAGALGRRLDQTLVNLALLESYSARLELELLGEDARILRPGRHAIRCRRGDAVTLLPATPRARLSSTGLLYPLKNLTLARSSRGLSNAAASSRVRLRVAEGRVWVLRRGG